MIQTVVVRCGYPLDALVGEVSGGGDAGGARRAGWRWGAGSEGALLKLADVAPQVAEHPSFFSTLIGLPGDRKFMHAVDRHGRPQWHFLGRDNET